MPVQKPKFLQFKFQSLHFRNIPLGKYQGTRPCLEPAIPPLVPAQREKIVILQCLRNLAASSKQVVNIFNPLSTNLDLCKADTDVLHI